MTKKEQDCEKNVQDSVVKQTKKIKKMFNMKVIKLWEKNKFIEKKGINHEKRVKIVHLFSCERLVIILQLKTHAFEKNVVVS